MKATFTPTQSQIRAASAVFICMAHEQIIRGIVEDYQREILSNHQFKDDYTGEIITNPTKPWRMNDTDFEIYLKECNQARIKSGLKVESEDFCPLLVAEDLTRKSRWNLIETMEPVTNINGNDLLCSGLKNFNKYIDLILSLLAPFCKDKLRGAKRMIC